MTIHFYLDNKEETQITSMYDLFSNPFKIGDEISLDVEELYPVEYNMFKESYQIKMINDNIELQKQFKRKKIKLIKEKKYVRFKVASQAKLTIEYHCILIED